MMWGLQLGASTRTIQSWLSALSIQSAVSLTDGEGFIRLPGEPLASCESGEGTTGHNPLTLAIVPFYNLNRIRGMAAKTTHIIPRDGGWIVKKEPAKEPARFFVERRGDQWAVKRPGAKRASAVYATQKEAIDAARKTVLRSSAGQIVVHNRNGSIRWRDLHGLPAVQRPPRRSQLGTKAIERAVSTVIRERLERD
jgi:hypothetical protein